MQFRTELSVKQPLFLLSSQERVTLLGSCFTDNIGEKLTSSGVTSYINPCGVQYNPLSIAGVIRTAIEGIVPTQTCFTSQGRTRCWLLPTRFSSDNENEAIRLFNNAMLSLKEALLSSSTLIITLGTAWIYEHTPSATSTYSGIVSNCHKINANEFNRRRLSVTEITETWLPVIKELNTLNPNLRFIFTVSPIRHFKDGAHENTLSKSTLHLAIEELCNASTIPVDYFPAYELLMDDLRDYRFYAEDMLHPSSAAVEYIWEHFCQTYFSAKDRATLKAAHKASLRNRHRPIIKDQ